MQGESIVIVKISELRIAMSHQVLDLLAFVFSSFPIFGIYVCLFVGRSVKTITPKPKQLEDNIWYTRIYPCHASWRTRVFQLPVPREQPEVKVGVLIAITGHGPTPNEGGTCHNRGGGNSTPNH
ncbi:hypothetical protein AVEN_203226-1 [Araneus ventricosus]|uniref:Uncharacterized protein n=1 Tax=Araneus ventricosus TaxID=182803 RepID=A0A4Y2F0J9_ARAVE|nr:hypothetical protein AVEN_203226-1 [Araneus ventricosus]